MKTQNEYLWGKQKFTEEPAANSYCNLYQMNKFLEEHTLRVQIYIKELLFSIVSPAKITFQISSEERHLAESKKTYSLEGESILPYERLSFTISADFDTRKGIYMAKELSLTVDYTSSKGKYGKKVVKFDPLIKSKDQKSWVLPAQITSQFKIAFTTSYSLLSKKTKSSQVISNPHDPFGLISGKGSRVDRKGSAINQLIKNDTKRDSQANFLQKESKKLQQVKSVPIQSKRHITRNRFLSPKYVEQSDETTKAHEELDELRKKIQQQRQEKVRSISKLKMQIGGNFLGGNHIKEDDSQLSKLKQKLRNLQKKEKSYLLNIEELNQELEKRKTKIGQLQKTKEEIERILAEKDIKLKSTQNNLKILSEQLDSLTSKERVTSKKNDAREGVFRDQLTKLENKLKITEMEVIRANQQKNSIIKSFSELQKIHQASLKEKDKLATQQKSKIFKIKEEWSLQQKSLMNSIEELTAKTEIYLYEKNQTEQKISSLQNSIFKYQAQLQSIKDSSKRIKQDFERNHQQTIKNLTVQLNTAKLRGNELNSQNSNLKQKIKRLQTSRNELQSKLRDLQEIIKLKNAETTKNTIKINSLKLQLDSANEDNSRKGRQIQNLKQTNINMKSKWSEAKQKLDEERGKRQQLSCLLEKQMNDFSKQKQSYEGEIKDLKWIVDRNNDSINELQYQIKDLNSNSLSLNQQLMMKSQRMASLEEKNKIISNENDHLSQQKVSLAAKIKQLTESLKIKTMQWQEERKSKAKAQARAEQQKERAQQYLIYSKGRQTQDGDKLRQKQQLCSKKLDELNALDLQISKKNEQISLLKNSCESILRQMQLCKMDNDNTKNELNLLESNFKNIKQEYSILQIDYQSLTTNLSVSDQNCKVLTKKLQLITKEFQDYRTGIQSTLENLLVELFKQENNSSNVIAATLLPFPSPKLSNLQVQLVQRRNSFIIKNRQKISDLTNQIGLLENQLKQLKVYQDARFQTSSKHELQQREKLKSLLYENMVQKNRLGQELANERKQREDIQKQIQKLKGQLFRKDDNEQELNGQLQMLLLEYDGIKNENQDLNDSIFKYKEQQIKLKSEFEQKLSTLQEDLSSQLEKSKIESIQREKKSIQLEKQLIETSSKMQRIEEQKQKSKQEIQMLKDNIKILEDKLTYYQGDITRLNNTIRSIEKRELNYKENIDKYEQQLSQQASRYETLQSGCTKISSELFQANVFRQQLAGELQHYKEKCSQLQKLILQKGEVNKQKVQRKIEENSQLRSSIIQKTSEIELRDFYLKQKQQQNLSLTEQIQELKKSQVIVKSKLKELYSALQDSQSKIKQLTQCSEQAAREVLRKDQLLGQSNFMIISLQNQIEQSARIGEILKMKQKQCIQLREGKSQMEEYYLQQLKKSKTTIGQLKKQIKVHKLSLQQLEDEYKASIENVSKSNNKKYRYLEAEWMQDKDEFSKRVEEIQIHNRKIIAQFESRLQKAREDLQDSKDSQKNLIQQLHKKQAVMKANLKKIQLLENEVEQIKHKYNKYYLLHQQAKFQEQNASKDSQNRLLNTLQNNKTALTRQFVMKIQDIDRKIKRVKQSQQIDIRSQTYSKKQIQFLLDRIFSKLNDIIKESEFTSGLLWERSKVQSTLM